jgi:glucan phosphoethanolaminetransferase (alkaline phosphatase superfamily)
MMNALLTPQPNGILHYTTTKLNIIFIVISWIAFAMLVWIRRKYLKRLRFDDWLMLVALVC